MNKISAVLFDLDGTVYRGGEAIDGASEFIDLLYRNQINYLFVTNRGNRRPELIAEQLQSMNIRCTAEDILTSSQAVAMQLEPATRVYCIGEGGLSSILEDHGIQVLDHTAEIADAVVVSYDRDLDYQKLCKAVDLINSGARFIATNTDSIITIENRILPEAGPLVAAVQNATGITPEVFGKPEQSIIDAACQRLNKPVDDCVIVGDNLFTDILAGQQSAMRSALILTGVSTRKDCETVEIKPTWISEDYAELEKQLFLEPLA
jgi:HAD superfamily hydrolase (TIGR01457 family)